MDEGAETDNFLNIQVPHKHHSCLFAMWHVKKKRALQGRLVKSTTISFLSELTARSFLLSPCCVRANMDELRWALGRLHRVVGVLC